MNKYFFLAGLIFLVISCNSTKKDVSRDEIENVQQMELSKKRIKYLTKDWENEIYTKFESHNLNKVDNNLLYDGKTIFRENEGYEYFYEIFEKEYLIVSIKKKNNWSWSSPENVTKDSISIINLLNNKESLANLKKVKFARCIDDLINVYHYSKNTIINDEYSYYYAIDSLNLETNELFLVQPNLKIKKYDLFSIK